MAAISLKIALTIVVVYASKTPTALSETFPETPFVNTSLPSKYDKFACREWHWADAAREKVHFSIQNSEWPTFLTYKAWDSCEGCLSAGGFAHSNDDSPADNSAESFQVIGDWMRISSLEQGNTVTLSTADSEEHWFNPPRSGTNDKPLEMEWYVFMDGSDFVDDRESLTLSSWSAFWAFGHGTGKFGWPTGGELDLLEYLPAFSPSSSAHGSSGATTGFHNAISGAYPPCCMEPDNVTYPSNASPEKFEFEKSSTNSSLIWPEQSKFRSWGQAINVARGEEPGNAFTSDQQTYNNVMHIYLRCTTTTFDIWMKPNANVSAPPPIDQKTDPGQEFGYAHVFRAYGDFGSNADATYADAFPHRGGKNSRDPEQTATNWHQNMQFVWSIVRFPNEKANAKKLLFYLSDIHIRGGGNHKAAMAPPNTPEDEIYNATIARDGVGPCQWISGGAQGCSGRLQRYMDLYHPKDYGV